MTRPATGGNERRSGSGDTNVGYKTYDYDE